MIKRLGGNTAHTSPSNVIADKTVLGLSNLLLAILARERTGQVSSGWILWSHSLSQASGILSVDHLPWGIG